MLTVEPLFSHRGFMNASRPLTRISSDPVPPSARKIDIPADQYRHNGAPTEWWWHIGTLHAGGRAFGFEIAATSVMVGSSPVAFSRVMLSDVVNNMHFQQQVIYDMGSGLSTFAQADPVQDWFVNLGVGAESYISMTAPWWKSLDAMSVKAAIVDQETGTPVVFDLMLSQNGPPLYVQGTGEIPTGVPSPHHLIANNYYYSLTALEVTGTVQIGNDAPLTVIGMTWMDHEYGSFTNPSGQSPKWALQDVQLTNGVHLSNYCIVNDKPLVLNESRDANASVRLSNGDMFFVPTTLTPRGTPWVSPHTGITYFMEFDLAIPDFNASLHLTTLMEDQEFYSAVPPKLNPVYEGAAAMSGFFEDTAVDGEAWNEQSYSDPTA